MKNLTKLLLIIVLCNCFLCNISFGQFYTNFGINNWGQTDNTQKIEAIGIGD